MNLVGSDISPRKASQLFENNAFILLLGLPRGTEIGIDCRSWYISDDFMGFKMVPKGIHFVYYSITNKHKESSARRGFFTFLSPRAIICKKWDPAQEDLVDHHWNDSADMTQHDTRLACYPFEQQRRWISLTNYIGPDLLSRLQPTGVTVFSAPQLFCPSSNTADRKNGEILSSQVEETCMRYSRISRREFVARLVDRSQFSAITASVLDRSDEFDSVWPDCVDLDVVGELQLSFVVFLCGQDYSSFEHWRDVVGILCTCRRLLGERSRVFSKFMSALYFQLKEMTEDVFVDIVARQNFVYLGVRQLLDNIEDVGSPELRAKADQLKGFCAGSFSWDFDFVDVEDMPTVVET